MAEEWFLASKGKGFGPFSPAQLKQMVEAGLADHDDLVWEHGDSESIPVSAIGMPPPLPVRNSTSQPPLPAKKRSESYGSILMGWFSIAVLVLVVFGGGGWFAYERGWLPFVDSFLLNDNVVESVATRENDGATEQDESTLSEEKNEENDSKVAAVDPTEAAVIAAEKPESRQEDLHSFNAGTVASGNVALASRGAVATGPYAKTESLLDGRPDVKDNYAKALLNVQVIIRLPNTYQLRRIRLNLIAAWLPNNSKDSFYQYKVEVSADGYSYELLADRTTGRHRDWQNIEFSPRPVRTIRITGTNDHPHQSGIRIAEVEAYCN